MGEPLMPWVAASPDPELLEAARALISATAPQRDRKFVELYNVVSARMKQNTPPTDTGVEP